MILLSAKCLSVMSLVIFVKPTSLPRVSAPRKKHTSEIEGNNEDGLTQVTGEGWGEGEKDLLRVSPRCGDREDKGVGQVSAD